MSLSYIYYDAYNVDIIHISFIYSNLKGALNELIRLILKILAVTFRLV